MRSLKWAQFLISSGVVAIRSIRIARQWHEQSFRMRFRLVFGVQQEIPLTIGFMG